MSMHTWTIPLMKAWIFFVEDVHPLVLGPLISFAQVGLWYV
jgi:hypothetical protein